MEEQNKSKVVEMSNADNQEQKKLTYEELNNAAIQLSKENQYLKHQLQGASEALRAVNRLDYLFKVVEVSSKATSRWEFSDAFVADCLEEIEKIMTIPEESEESKEN